MKKNKLLIVHENKQDLLTLIDYLNQEGFQTEGLERLNGLKDFLKNSSPDLIMIPVDHNGTLEMDLCNFIKSKEKTAHTMVVFLSQKKEEYAMITALESGADDFLVQPIHERLFSSRIKALLRRKKKHDYYFINESIIIDRERYLIIKKGVEYYLPKKEFEILSLLFSKPNKVFSREEIKNAIWENFEKVRGRTVDVHIRKIREKIGEGLITTVKGVGYRLDEV